MVHLMDGNCPDFRAIQFEPKLVKQKNEMEGQERRDAIRKIFGFVDYEPRLDAMAAHSGLLGTLEQIMGDTPELFQDMALVKPPRHGSEKPWHQDCAYFNLPEGTTVVGVWIALDEATPENGCLHVIPGSHNEGPMIHFKRRDWQICDTDVPVARDTMVPLKPGRLPLLAWIDTPRKPCQPIGSTATRATVPLQTGEYWRNYNPRTDGCLR